MVVVFPILQLLTMKVVFEYSLLRHECLKHDFAFFLTFLYNLLNIVKTECDN